MAETQKDAGSQETFNFVAAEKNILEFWKQHKTFQKTLDKTKKLNKPYIFYDGPPFATGLPHHGHLVGGTLKDIIPRYFTMKGYYVERRFGWDCHGLPIEQEIDKKHEMSAMDFVAKHGVKKYNEECRAIVQRFTKEWEKTVNRLGRWVDFENDYKTMDLSFMESVWWVFKQAWDKKLIYKGSKIVPFSTALGTGLSNFEATSNYQSVQDPAVTVLLKLKDEDRYIAIWTTTPWTLPSNLGLCVNENLEYVEIHDKDLDKKLILAADRVAAYSKKRNLEELCKFSGKDLKGKKYEPLFPFFKDLETQGAFQIFTDNYVTTEDGTGVVHLAPAFGQDDNRVFQEAGLKEVLVCPIDDKGQFTQEVTSYSGQYVKDADAKIIKDLKAAGQLYEHSTLVHNYPFCPRTDTPLIYKTMPQWYLAVEKIKDDLVASNKDIYWIPGHIKEGRFGKWLENAKDWAISRNRVWGTPLPIWENESTGNFVCVGSIEELKKYSGVELNDLHREFTDEVSFSIPGEEGVYTKIPEVLDCWFESGSMPYAQLHYPFENQDVFDKGFPAEFIAEGLDQTRGWFYTLTVLSSMLHKKPAFKHVIVNGMVLAEDGRKMSKRLKNYTQPDILMESYGADALRLYMINSGIVRGEELRFSDDEVKDMVRRALLPWYNSFKFFQTYAGADGWSPKEHFIKSSNILDKWLTSKMQTLIERVNQEMTQYKLYNVVPALFSFIEDLTNWYIRLNRRRFWEGDLTEDKKAAFSTLYETLKTLNIVMAPFAPFLSEHLHQECKKMDHSLEESVHLCNFPEADIKVIDRDLEDAVKRMFETILLGRQKRSMVNIKVKMPLQSLTIIHRKESILNNIKQLESFIRTELNIKKIHYSQDEGTYINLKALPNAPVLGPKLGKEFGKFRQKFSNLSVEELEKIESGEGLKIDDHTFTAEDFLIKREAKEGTEALSNSFISIDLDTKLNPELVQEGLAREVVNRIQKTRKDLDFHVSDRIQGTFSGDKELIQAIQKHQNYIQDETLMKSLKFEDPAQKISFKIDNYSLHLSLERVATS